MKLSKRLAVSACLGALIALGMAVAPKSRGLAAGNAPISRSGAGLKWKVMEGRVASDPLRDFAPPVAGKLCYSFDTLQGLRKSFLAIREGSRTTTFDFSGNDFADNLRSASAPTFSPDGQNIAFVMDDPEGLDRPNGGLYLLNLATGSIRRASQSTIQCERVEWSRDGRYLTFIKGGDADGRPVYLDGIADQPSLWVTDVQTGREWCAAKDNDGLNGGFAWGEHDQLFFSAQTKNQGSAIYKMKPGSAKMLVLSDARCPLPSPSGAQIAFVRGTNFFTKTATPALCIAGSDGTKRRVLRREEADARLFPLFAWSRDEKRLFRVEGGATSRRGEATVFNLQIGKTQHIGQFHSAAYQGLAPSFANLHEEKGELVCCVNSLTGTHGQDYYSTSQTLQSLDTKAHLHIWATSTGSSTLVWHPSSAG